MKRPVNSQKYFNFLIALLALLWLGSLPYFNLILKAKLALGGLFAFLILTSPLSGEFLIKIAIILLTLALFFTLGHRFYPAELIGEAIYGFLVLGVIKKAAQFLKKPKNGRK